MEELDKPFISKDLIKYLELIIGYTPPSPKDKMEDIMYQAGKNSILTHLKDLEENQ